MLKLQRLCAAGIVAFGAIGLTPPAQSAPVCDASQAKAGFSALAAWNEARQELAQNYAYWDRFDAAKAFDAAAPAMVSSPDRLTFADRLQTLLLLFRDSHLHVTPTSSPALAWVPSAADLWFERSGGRFVVRDVKQGSIAAERGIRPGWELVQIEGVQPQVAVQTIFAPLGLKPDPDQELYALNTLASGRLKQPRHFRFQAGGRAMAVALPPGYDSVRRPSDLLTLTRQKDATGHIVEIIRINNSLGDNRLIAAFDNALAELPADAHVILDLRDTPSGGNSTVARAIIGHFIVAPQPYQRHELTAERVLFGVPRTWLEYAQPRAPVRNAPLVLAGLWTGSMGEGLVIGLNGAAGAPVVGSPMGQLLGAVIDDELPTSCLTLAFANERLWHVNGTLREDFVPTYRVAAADTPRSGGDAALAVALEQVEQSDKQPR